MWIRLSVIGSGENEGLCLVPEGVLTPKNFSKNRNRKSGSFKHGERTTGLRLKICCFVFLNSKTSLGKKDHSDQANLPRHISNRGRNYIPKACSRFPKTSGGLE